MYATGGTRRSVVALDGGTGEVRWVYSLREGNRAVVEWHDSAPGVPDEDVPRLTERLYRVESSRNRASGGSGLGLAIARAIVEGHGGTLTASRSPLGGLAIRLVFPRLNGGSRA